MALGFAGSSGHSDYRVWLVACHQVDPRVADHLGDINGCRSDLEMISVGHRKDRDTGFRRVQVQRS